MNIEKNRKIKETFLATRKKRQLQDCKVFSIKLQKNRLNKKQMEQLKMLFVEAKWLKNDILNYFDVNHSFDYQITKTVDIKRLDDSFETKPLQYLGSQMKQSVYTDIIANLKTLHTLKVKGKKIGKLKFCSEYKSINLKQFGNTYRLLDDKYVKIQNITGRIKVNGLKQITEKYECANAKLLNCPDGYYLKITCYSKKETKMPSIHEKIGIDMGIKNNLTLSNGQVFNASVQESDRLKRLQKVLFKKVKGSENRRKIQSKIRVEYQKLTNKKNDLVNKIFHELDKYEFVAIQDEMISNWKSGLFGKQIQHSVLGRIKSKIKEKIANHDNRFVIILRSCKTTQTCSVCGKIHKLSLSDRKYICECGNDIDRDLNSAINILKIGVGRTELKPVETYTSSEKQKRFCEAKYESVKQEDATSLV